MGEHQTSDVEGAPTRVLKRFRVPPSKRLGALTLSMLAVALGVVAGLGAFAFRGLIGFCHNLLFLGRFSFAYDSNLHTPPGPWGIWIVLVPVVGAVFVVFLVKNFAPEARGHGVPEVMDAIYYKKGVIRPIVAVVKSLASAVSIGSGGSVGREGPIIQIGAAFASSAGRLAGASRWQLATLVAAGGGAGIAATFNTPIGGVLFAVEVLMHEVSVRTLVPVALATATATYVGQYLLGSHPAFPVPSLVTPVASGAPLLVGYVGLGCLMAFVSVLFIRVLYGAEDLFDRMIPKRDYLRHIVGMLGVGVLMTLLIHLTGHYYVEGVGYATILDILSSNLTNIGFLVALFVLKLAATSTTLGSGASGGIFSPSLFMGATLGAAYGLTLRACVPGLHVDPAAFALAGMAGLVAGATGAALTAIVMIFEMTLDYSVVLPMTLTAAVAYGLRRALCAESIYTMKLTRRQHYMPQALQANAHLVHHVSDLVLDAAAVIPADTPLDQLDLADSPDLPRHIVLTATGKIVGVISRNMKVRPRQGQELGVAADAAQTAFVTVPADAMLVELLEQMARGRASVAVIVPAGTANEHTISVLGIVTAAGLNEALAEGMALFGD